MTIQKCAIYFAVCSAVMTWFMSEPRGDVPFDHVVIDDSGPRNPWTKIVADFTGDGYVDIAVGGQNGPLVLYAYPSWTKMVIADGGYTTVDGEAGDFDNDGDADIVMGGLVWFENPLPGSESGGNRWNMHTITNHPTHDIELADLDGDGNLDILTRDQSEFGHAAGDTIHVWLCTNQTLSEHMVISCPHGEGLSCADLDGDGDEDIVTGGIWFENTQDKTPGKWKEHHFASFHANATVMTADIDNDGDDDVVLTPSELKDQYHDIFWFENPGKNGGETWEKHPVETGVECVYHSLDLADVDFDGQIDIVTAEMHQGADPDEVSVYFNSSSGESWKKQVLSTRGSHYLRAADMGNDGDIDIVGANHGGDYQPIELWENHLSDGNTSLNSWTYIEVDSDRAKWGDWNEPAWAKYFGIAMADVTGDSFKDIASGRYFYRNPGGDMTSRWERTDFGLNVDAMLFTDVDGDDHGDVIAEALPDVYWLEARDRNGRSWRARKIGSIPKTGHGNGQGYMQAQILPGGKPELLLSSGDGIYMIGIPENPDRDIWPAKRIAAAATEEGIGVGDIDGDGDLDIAAGSGEKKGDGMTVSWWENPGDGGEDWTMHLIGETIRFADRFAIADLNRDGRQDVIVTEERWPEPENAHVFWFEQANGRGEGWTRHTISTQNTSNNLDIADMDGDGDIDIVTAEHRGTKKVQVFENSGDGSRWIQHVVSVGKESHLGARVADMDNDGDYDILSIAWDSHRFLHLWRNDASPGSSGAHGSAEVSGRGGFYREYWAEWNESVTNHPGRLRVNDAEVSLDEAWGKRTEARTNGLMLVNIPEDLFLLESSELYMELWGGHPGTANKRIMLNGKAWYHFPKSGTEAGHCTYSYPKVPVRVGHMVSGINAFQFACDRGTSFWGHFIIDNACVRCSLKPGHPDLVGSGLGGFSADVKIESGKIMRNNEVVLSLIYPGNLENMIQSVDYFGRYKGYDDTGDGSENGWHGFTFKRKPVNHIGTISKAPFAVTWDTAMLPDQEKPVAVRAAVHLKDNIHYETPVLDGILLPLQRKKVRLYKCTAMPVPFWSRASQVKKAVISLPDDPGGIERSQLYVKVWDGGEGTVKEPFTINGHPYTIVSGRQIHDVVFTVVDVDPGHLRPGDNEFVLLSDTEHHGIEMLLPGPCLIVRLK